MLVKEAPSAQPRGGTRAPVIPLVVPGEHFVGRHSHFIQGTAAAALGLCWTLTSLSWLVALQDLVMGPAEKRHEKEIETGSRALIFLEWT